MEKIRLPLLEDGLREKDINNGIYNIKSNTPMSSFYVIYKGGASIERPGTLGISHLMEHLMTKSFEKFDKELIQNGVMFNAFTSNDRVAFYMNGLDRYIDGYKEKLVESMFEFDITEEEFELEKSVVLEEYDMSFDSRTDIHFYNTYRKLFDFYCAIGKRDDIKNFTLDECYDYHKKFFSNPHQIINISERYAFNDNVELASDFKFRKIGLRKTNESATYEQSNYTGNNASFIFVSPMVDEADIPACEVISKMINNGLHSPLMEELRGKRGLVYYVHCSIVPINDNNCNIIISTQSNENNADTIKSVVSDVMENKDKFITSDNFMTTKNNMEISKEKSKIFNFANVDKLIYENIDVYNFIDTMTFEKCQEVYDKYFNFDKWIKSIDKNDFSDATNENKKVTNGSIIKLHENRNITI